MQLPVRQYRCHAAAAGAAHDESRFGPVRRTLELDPAATAVITVDLWNVGWSSQPLIPELGLEAELNFIGLGRRAAAEARRLTEHHLAPLLAAARTAGMTVLYSNLPEIVARYPACARYANGSSGGPEPTWPPAELSAAVLDDYFRTTFGPDAPEAWRRLRTVVDLPDPVKPHPGDICVHQTAAALEVLAERRITTVIHAGFLLAHCLLDGAAGLRSTVVPWRRPGYRGIVVRDATLAQEWHDTVRDFGATRVFIRWLESSGIPTTTATEFIAACR